MKSLTLKTKSPGQTKKVARIMAGELLKTRSKKHALVLALSGELGSGKTTFVQGLARGFVIRLKIKSPTFLIIKNYKLTAKNYGLFIHIDAYRLTKPKDILALGWHEMARNPKNIIAIEWARRIKKVLPKNHFDVNFKHTPGNKRIIKFHIH